MKIINCILFFVLLSLNISCNSGNENEPSESLAAPTNVSFERIGELGVTLSWIDNSSNETGFNIWIRNASNSEDRKVIATTSANQHSYSITSELQDGGLYYFGVQAVKHNGKSTITYSPLCKLNIIKENANVVITDTKSTDACISVSYAIKDIDKSVIINQGLCWCKTGEPSILDNLIYGPKPSGTILLQTIPNILIEYGIMYNVRAFVKTSSTVYYSSTQSLSLGVKQAPITLSWNKISIANLSDDIEVYETTSKLNGKNFHAWYAIADLAKGNIELRACVPQSATTIDAQMKSYNGKCLVMVNGGYFYNGRHTGISVINSVLNGSVSAVRGSLKSADSEYNEMYNITRGIFGVDATNKASVYWAGTDESGITRFYECPLPSIKGESKYNIPSSTIPVEPSSWSPKYALSAGPVLLKNGKCPFDFTTTKGDDYYLNNYEIMPYDIFGTSVSPDRTALGVTSSGKVIMFICDGRITESCGATLVQLAQIMKGIGCVDAVNFDGGGSTGMVVCGKHINDQTGGNRAVVSTFGFFLNK